mgnify:CR=1 FL=1|jgi:hypothetical protein
MTKDILFYNASIPGTPQGTDALFISGGKINFVGKAANYHDQLPVNYESIDLEGKAILPGFCDHHLHLQYLADRLDAVDCETNSLEECLLRVEQRAALTPAGEWIIGYGWNQNDWQPAQYGTAAQLDAISQQHPILLHAKSLHAAWANSLAMKIAGIDATSTDPQGSALLRDLNGNPTGILLENAIFLVAKQVPAPGTDAVAQHILRAQSYLHSLGITAVHDFDRFESAQALLSLVEKDLLRLRVKKNLPSEDLPEILAGGWRDRLGKSSFLQPGWVKLFADGALGPQSAAMLAPYEGTQNRGMLLLSADQIAKTGIEASKDGWALSVHAIGDRAVRETLEGIALVRDFETNQNLPHLPHRIEHIQLIQADDLKKMKALNVIASVQPVHATADMYTAERLWGERCQFAYAYNDMFRHELTVWFGSDAPVESPEPSAGLFAAVTRQRPDGLPGKEGWYPQQRVSLSDALRAYRQVDASLVPGAAADLIVLETDPAILQPHEIHQLKPLLTMVAGDIVFTAE